MKVLPYFAVTTAIYTNASILWTEDHHLHNEYIYDTIQKELTDYFSSKDSVILDYLFGSTVRGDSGRLSDVDIGVLLDEKYYIKRHTEETMKRIAEVGFS